MLPELWGGSADLAESNNTTTEGEPSFLPDDRQSKEFPGGPYGRVLHFGIREHAMGSILNGIALHGGTRPYGGTFLVFSDYMRPAVRLAALMELPVTYVWTHDSIGLGEDGPTHQPVEHLAALRAIPGLDVVRPADANETVGRLADDPRAHRPAGRAVLTRQNVPIFDRAVFASAEGVARGGYVLADASDGAAAGDPHRHRLRGAARRRGPRACSRPRAPRPGWSRCRASSGSTSRTRPTAQQVLPERREGAGQRRGRASRMGWRDIVGDAGEIVSLEHFGAARRDTVLFEQFGFTRDRVVAAAHATLGAGRRDHRQHHRHLNATDSARRRRAVDHMAPPRHRCASSPTRASRSGSTT